MFWSKIQVDNTNEIFLGNRAYPLQCDKDVYDTSIEIIKNIFRGWIVSEISLAEKTNQERNKLLVISLRDADIKVFAHDEPIMTFRDILRDTPISMSGSRFADLIIRINMNIPSEIIDVCTGKFLFSMLYGISKEVNNIPMPTKEQWQNALCEFPWIPYLIFYQEVYDSDEIIKRVEQLVAKIRMSQTTITRAANLNI